MRYLYILILSIFLFNSCSDDDPKDVIPNENDAKDSSSNLYQQSNTLKDVDPNTVSIEDEGTYQEIEPIQQPVPTTPKKNISSYNDSRERVAEGTIFTDGNSFVVQESAWKTKQRAEARANTLSKKGHETFVTTKRFANGQTWYRVRIGYFNSLAEAKKAKARL